MVSHRRVLWFRIAIAFVVLTCLSLAVAGDDKPADLNKTPEINSLANACVSDSCGLFDQER